MTWSKFLQAAVVGAAFIIAGRVTAAVNLVVPATPPTAPLAFETGSNWSATAYTPAPSVGPELTPPGFDSTFFMNNFDGTVVMSQPRTGEGGTQALGAMGIGTGDAGQITTFIMAADATFTGLERTATGEYNATLRHIRVGLDDTTPAVHGDTTTVFPWGVVKQTAGTVRLAMNTTEITSGPVLVAPQPERAELMLSSDKDNSAGSLWEVGGTASLFVPDDLRLGDRASVRSMPGSIFRVRGSSAGRTIEVGDAYQVASDAGLWDADRPEEFGGRLRFRRGKSVTEFVLDAGGVTPITVLDNLDIGDFTAVNSANLSLAAGTSEYSYGFLRIKLSEPTTAGSGAAGSEGQLVLFRADRISTDVGGLPTGTDFDNGRFFDPDRPSAVGPHQPLFDSENAVDGPGVIYNVVADYAGATYTWRLDYFNSVDDGTVEDSVMLSELQVTGTPGDYNGGGLAAADLNQILGARGTAIALGSAQNQFDLNADDAIDNLDAIQWITHGGFLNSRLGDFDLDRDVDAADLTILKAGFGTATSYVAGDADLDGDVDGRDFLVWQRNVGGPNPAAGAAGAAVNAVPEPAAAVLALAALALAPLRRRR
jgi:uncharacterized protein (TIGR03382 family)